MMKAASFPKCWTLAALAAAFSLAMTLPHCGSTTNTRNIPTRACLAALDVAVHEFTLEGNAILCALDGEVVVVDFENGNGDSGISIADLFPLRIAERGADAFGSGGGNGNQQSIVTAQNDSGTTGMDLIPYKTTEAGTYVFEFDDEDGASHFAVMTDSSGAEVFRIEANRAPVSTGLEPGSYNLYLYNRGEETVPLFIQPVSPDDDASHHRRLISIRQCHGCNLAYSDLSESDLSGASLAGADLSFAKLTGANLSGANLSGATWTDGNKVCAEGSIGVCK